jgi:hypothetical protein
MSFLKQASIGAILAIAAIAANAADNGYKLLQGARSNPQDFNFMIMVESPSWASYDQLPDQLEALAGKFAGTAAKAEETAKTGMADRTKIRTVFGGKNMQEIVFTR